MLSGWRRVSSWPTSGCSPSDLTELKRLFEHATTFGSLIQVPEELAERLPALKQLSEATSQDLFVSDALKRLGPLVQQAEMLGSAVRRGRRESAVYGQLRTICQPLSKFIDHNYPAAKTVSTPCFMLAESEPLSFLSGRLANINIPGWMDEFIRLQSVPV